jgi:hypothetical protein
MLADIYRPDLWDGFFTMVGGGVAALAGLIFVALSLNVADMTRDVTHKYRSINTLAGLTAVFVRCGLALMAAQNHEEIGAEFLVVALIGTGIFLHGFRQAFKFKAQPEKRRLVTGSCLYAAEIVGAVVLISGSIAGLYVVAIAMLLNVAFMVSAAWLLVVGVYSERMRSS